MGLIWDLDKIAERNRGLVIHYRQGLTMRECADIFGITLGRVQQILKKLIPKEIRPKHVIPKRRLRQCRPLPSTK
jgi:DNA-directed RNA polymerase specialized sigma subunit